MHHNIRTSFTSSHDLNGVVGRNVYLRWNKPPQHAKPPTPITNLSLSRAHISSLGRWERIHSQVVAWSHGGAIGVHGKTV